MNKNRFRIIFNELRGLFMAVPEHVRSHTAGSSTTSLAAVEISAHHAITVTLRPVAFCIMLALGLVSIVPTPFNIQSAHAEARADHSAPPNKQPTVLAAPNGVEVVNIQTPNARGVSHNIYSVLNVPEQGLIFNNSRSNVQTQLGGWVQGNPWLATGSASIILNEVNSNNPSYLNGFMEIAGSRAELIIANPAGISCNGCGFINASRGVLTTGAPQLSGGDLIGYRVTGGTVSIWGNGLDASRTNYTDIIARTVEVNAGLWANDLKITTGANEVNASNSQATVIAASGPAPAASYALDVSALGGMYAGKITLVGTEAGLGVRNAGSIGTTAGSITITADGQLQNSGSFIARADAAISTSGNISNSGTLYAQANVNLTTQADIANTGLVAAQGNSTLTANGSNSHISSGTNAVLASGFNTDGTLAATGSLILQATQSISAQGQNLAAGDQTLIARQLDISGSDTLAHNLNLTASAGDIQAANAVISVTQTLTASTSQTLHADVAAITANQLNFSAHDLSNVGGELVQTGTGNTVINLAGNLDNTQGRIATNSGNLTLAAQTITNTSASIEHAGTGTLTINTTALNGQNGTIISNGALNLTAANANLSQGSTVANQIGLDTATLNNQNGEIIQTGNAATSIKATRQLDNTQGLIASNGNTSLITGNLINQAGTIKAVNSSLNIQASGIIDNKAFNGMSGSLQAGGNAIISSTSIDNMQGQVTAGGSLNVTTTDTIAGINNRQGLIAANQDVSIAGAVLDNASATIASVYGSTDIKAKAGAIDNTAGSISAAKALTSQSVGLNNTDGKLLAGTINIDTRQQTLNNTRGSIIVSETDVTGMLNLQTGSLNNDAGLIQSGANLVVDTHGNTLSNINSGASKGLLAQGGIQLDTGLLDNRTGYIGAGGNLTANSNGINNQGSTILSEGAITLTTASLSNDAGHIEALDNLGIHTGSGNINNQSGLLRSAATLTLEAGSIDNSTTAGSTGAGLAQGIEAGQVSITANGLNNTSGAVRAEQNLAIIADGHVNNTQGMLSSQGTFKLQDKLANASSNVATKILDITNTGGTIIAGTIAGTVTGSASLTIDSRSLTGDGNVLTQGDLTTKLLTDFNNTGLWQATGNAYLVTTGKVTNQNKLTAGNTLTLNAQNLDNTATGEISATSTQLNVSNTLNNRGLIDSSDTFITTATLNNIGTGRIYGDHVAIAATTFNNVEESVNNFTQAAVIAARDRLDIGAQTITNREHGLLFSAGDMAIGGALDSNHEAMVGVGELQAQTLNNNSATIEAFGNLSLNIASINNTNEHFSTANEIVSESKTPARAVNMAGPTLAPAPDAGNTRKFQAANAAYTAYGKIYNYDEVHFYTPDFTYIYANDGSLFASYFWQYNEGTIVKETRVTSTDPGQILTGGNARITATSLLNDNSKIIAGGALNATVTNLDNREILGTRSSQYTSESSLIYPRASKDYSRVLFYLGDTAPVIETINLGTVTYLGNTSFTGTNTQVAALKTGNVSQSAAGTAKANVSINGGTSQSVNTHVPQITAITQPGTGTVIGSVNPNTQVSNNSLYHSNPNSTANYFVETDPRFANYRNWLSSDYLLNALNLAPALTQKRLGDGFYEQRLIREQINQLTGKRYLAGYTSDETEYQALMSNGATFAQAHQLIPGVVLTEAQTAQLTSDIVWLVEQTVTLPDGSTVQALVPQVYVRLQPDDINGNGSLLAGETIHLDVDNNLTNSGTIAGRTLTSISANNINNLKGRISGNITALNAKTDINNLGGTIDAQDTLGLNAGRDINIASTTKSNRLQYDAAAGNKTIHVDVSRTNIDRVAGLYVTNPNGVLLASADNNINLQAAQISNSGTGGTTVIDAGNDLSLSTITTAQNNSYVRDSRNYIKNSGTQEIGTTIQIQGDITLNANNNLTARAANVSSEAGSLTANAQNNLTIESGIATSHSESASYSKKKGSFSSKSKTTRDTYDSTDVVSSTFSGNAVNLNAGNDITIIPAGGIPNDVSQKSGNIIVKGSNVVGTQDVNLNAQNNINIETAQATHDESHYNKTKKSGFTASSTSVGYGSSKLTTTNNTQAVTNVGSTIGSVEGDVNINSGNHYTQAASDVLTPQGDINITAKNVDISSATDTYSNQQTMKYKQSGITLSVGNPVISAAQTVNQVKQAAKDTSDPRMQALAAGTAALAINNAANTLGGVDQYGNIATAGSKGVNDLTHVTQANAADQVGGINISLSIGSSKSSSSSQQTINTAKGSTLNAGGDINITATGDTAQPSNPNGGNINVIGSQLKAKDDITLTAQNDINLQAAQNTSKLDSKNKSSSASVGVSVNLGAAGGVGVTAGISSGKGKATGNGTTWTETTIQGGNQQGDTVTLNSGADTSIKSAQVSGNQVQANVGTSGAGNLNIASLQDTDQYKDKQSSNGISVTVPVTGTNWGGSISSSNSKTNSNYQSVNEQAGIYAGDGGFQVNVNGNTNLTGAVIASKEQAIQNNANSLTTQTLTTSNIENKAAYEAKGYSVAVGVGTTKQPDGTGLRNTPTASTGYANLNDDSNSVTVSAISGGSVNITNNTAQQQTTGKDTLTTVATLNRDVQSQLTTTKDGQGNATTTVAAIDGKGNNLASTLTPIFDKEQVQREFNAQIQITQAFSQVAPKAVGDYASSKLKEASDKLIQANDLNNGLTEEQRLQLVTEANDLNEAWKDGGAARVALHAVVGGLTGNLEGALGAGTTALTIPMIGEQLAKLDAPAEVKQALLMAASAVLGGAVGSTAGAASGLTETTNNYLTHAEVNALSVKLKECRTTQCINNLLRDAIILSDSRDGKDLSNRALYEAAHQGTVDLITLALLDPNQSFMVRQAALSLLNINIDDEGIGQQSYAKTLAAQLSLIPKNGQTIGTANSNVVTPERYAQNGQDALAAGYVIGTLGGGTVITAPAIPLGSSIVVSTATNTGINVYSQFDKYGEIKYPAELAINAGYGALEGYFGRFSGAGLSGIGIEALIGGSSNVATSLTTNWYYQNDKDHQYNLIWEAAKGALFGAGSKHIEDKYLTPTLK